VAAPVDGWLERDGVRLHFVEWRPDVGDAHEPPALLLHGLGSNARYWDRVVAHLPNRRLVALDQRGHGLTGRPPHAPRLETGFSMDSLLDDAVAVIDECGLRKPVVAGHSWGATVALELAGTRPEAVSGLVFIDGPVQSASSLFSWEDGQKFMQPPLPRFQSMTEARADAREEIESVWGDDLEPFVEARVIDDGDGLVLTLTAPVRLALLRGLYDSQPDVLWPSLSVPAVALLARDASPMVSSWKKQGAEMLAESAPHVTIKWFDTPHDIPLYAPAEVAAEIAAVGSSKKSESAAG